MDIYYHSASNAKKLLAPQYCEQNPYQVIWRKQMDRIAKLEAALSAALTKTEAGVPTFSAEAESKVREFCPISQEQETEYGKYVQDLNVAVSRVGGKAIIEYAKENADVGHTEIRLKSGFTTHGVSFARPTVKDGEKATKEQVRDGLGIHLTVSLSDNLKSVADDLAGLF